MKDNKMLQSRVTEGKTKNWSSDWSKLVQYPVLMSLGNDQKNTIASVRVRNKIFAKNWKSYVIWQSA